MRLALVSFLFCVVASPQGSDPRPQDATQAILAAFDKYQVVGMPAAHGFKDLDEYILSLIRHPALPTKVNDIVVECGNSLSIFHFPFSICDLSFVIGHGTLTPAARNGK